MRNVYIIEGDTVFVEDELGHSLRRYDLDYIFEGNGDVVGCDNETGVWFTATTHGELIGMIIEAEELEADPRT